MDINRLYAIIKKEFIHIFRDKVSFGIIIALPILYSLLFGYAIQTEVDNIKIAVLDNDKTYQSRQYISSFESSNYFLVTDYVNSINEIEKLIDNGTVKAALIIDSNYSENIQRNIENNSLLIIDGSDPTVATTALQSGILVSNFHEMNLKNSIDISDFGINTKVWYNPNLKSTKFILPGLIAIVMQNITVILTAFSLVREKEKGNLELLIVSPIKPAELILGKMIPYIFIGFFDFLLTLYFGTIYFDVKIVGSTLLLIGLGSIFVICALAMGMLISTVADNQLQAMQLSFVTILPSILLSGFMFPIEAMPTFIQWLSKLIPVTYFITISRGIILKGNTIDYLLKETIILIIFTIILLGFAIKKFHKTLD
jgi:ABC-2 type transport system permease protein